MNLAIIGPSGAGKGTHADSMASRFRLRHVATGDLFRENLHSHTALGILARKYMEHGELVPDEVVDAMIEEWCDHVPAERGTLIVFYSYRPGGLRYLAANRIAVVI